MIAREAAEQAQRLRDGKLCRLLEAVLRLAAGGQVDA